MGFALVWFCVCVLFFGVCLFCGFFVLFCFSFGKELGLLFQFSYCVGELLFQGRGYGYFMGGLNRLKQKEFTAV